MAGVVPFFTFNYLVKVRPFSRIDDTLGVMHTHLIAGAVGGLLVGLLADPNVIVYPGTGRTSAFSVTGAFFGNPKQFVAQIIGLVFILLYDGIATFAILKVLGLFVKLRIPDADLEVGDVAVHGDVAYELVPQPPGLMMSDWGRAGGGGAVRYRRDAVRYRRAGVARSGRPGGARGGPASGRLLRFPGAAAG